MFHVIYYLKIYPNVIGGGHGGRGGGAYQGPSSYQTSSGGGYQY